jgi:hypothetical protein
VSVTDFDVRLLELVEHLRDGDNTMRRDTYVQSPLGVLLTKPKERINMRYSLPVDLVDWARDEAKALGISASEFVEAQLDAARENWDDIHDDD